jgi:cysteine synthase
VLGQIGGTPLVRLRSLAGDPGAAVFAKCEHLNPGGSVKDRIALAIVLDAERRGVLKPGDTIVEATAGNTGIGLALVAGARGYRVVCVMPEKMSHDKRTSLVALGARLEITPDAPLGDPANFQAVARRLASEHGWFLADQFCNPANPRVHEETTGPEILAQCGGRVGAFVAGAGTGGTITGVGRFLRAACPGARVVLADPVGSGLADWVETGTAGPDTGYLIEGIGAGAAPAVLDRSVIDAAERVPDDESFAVVGRLLREEGLLVGGSAGTAVAAALRVARAGGLDGPVVALLPDSWDRYLSTAWLRAL